jgi:hypothetical protein
MEIQKQLEIEDILKSFKEQIGEQAQTIAILKATIEQLTKPTPTPTTTTAVYDKPKVEGPVGI